MGVSLDTLAVGLCGVLSVLALVELIEEFRLLRRPLAIRLLGLLVVL